MKAFTYVAFATTMVLGVQALAMPNINENREGQVCLKDGGKSYSCQSSDGALIILSDNTCNLETRFCCSDECYIQEGWEKGVCKKKRE